MSRAVTEPFADPLTERLASFVREIGLPIEAAVLDGSELLPGITVRDGRILVDEARLTHPGDLLHEAGHLAVSDPAVRATLQKVSDDGGEELSAMAWSYAAACHLGIDARLVFHDDFKGGGAACVAAYERGGLLGQPLLAWFGMTRLPGPETDVAEAFPRMQRWLR